MEPSWWFGRSGILIEYCLELIAKSAFVSKVGDSSSPRLSLTTYSLTTGGRISSLFILSKRFIDSEEATLECERLLEIIYGLDFVFIPP
jgi:hypothetical protein